MIPHRSSRGHANIPSAEFVEIYVVRLQKKHYIHQDHDTIPSLLADPPCAGFFLPAPDPVFSENGQGRLRPQGRGGWEPFF
jgi:hypothetical protein